MDLVKLPVQRKHDRLKRKQNDQLENIIHGIVKPVISSCDNVSCHRADHHDNENRKCRHNHTVFERIEIVCQSYCLFKISKIQSRRECQLRLCDLHLGLKCIADRHVKRCQRYKADNAQKENP